MINYNFNELTGLVVTKDDFSYEEDRKAWNRAIEKYPVAIIYCLKKEDVSNAVIWAKKNSIPIRIRSGCHHYEGYSTGNDVVVIDVSKMNNIYIDEERNTVKIDGGVRNRELYEALGNKGYPFPGGGCPTVGVAAFTLGGGWGYSSRLLGLGCDRLVEIQIIDYKGSVITANSRENEDLFWAVRGSGGGNFGVIVSMTFNLPEKIKMATLINIDYPHIKSEEAISLFEVYQKEFKTLDRRLNCKIGIYNSAERGIGIKIVGLFYGNKSEANKILLPFISTDCNVNISLEYITVAEANRKIQDSHPDYERYKSSGRFVYKDYKREEIREFMDIIKTRAEGAVYTAVSFYGLGGAVTDKSKDDSAFYYRDAKFIMGLQSVWEDPKYAPINREWVVDKFNVIKRLTRGSFINFPIAELDNYELEYYGENTTKLRMIKTKYDPEDIFNFPQGIKLI